MYNFRGDLSRILARNFTDDTSRGLLYQGTTLLGVTSAWNAWVRDFVFADILVRSPGIHLFILSKIKVSRNIELNFANIDNACGGCRLQCSLFQN